VEREVLERVVQAFGGAPSARNAQPLRLRVVREQSLRQRLQSAYRGGWLSEAPVVLVVSGVAREAWVRRDGVSYLLCDAAIATDQAVLQATALGLGSCWIAAFDAEGVREALSLPPEEEPLLLVALGYPPDGAVQPPRQRRPLEEQVVWL